jgi:ketosteroid isomerase-like protein
MSVIYALAVILATSVAPEQPIQVSFCELTDHAERYHSQLVAVQAMFHLDEWILYDPDCADGDHWISVEDAADSEKRLADRISGSLSGVVKGKFVGRFLGPNGYGYSHLGTARTQLKILEASGLRRVRRPKLPDYDAPAPQLELSDAIGVLGRRWLAAVRGRDAAELREILSEDYVAVLANGELLAGRQAVDALVLPHLKAIEARVAKGMAPDTFEMRVRIFSIDLQTAVSIQHVSLDGVGDAVPAEWQYVNIYRKTGSRWRLAFSQFTRTDAHQES